MNSTGRVALAGGGLAAAGLFVALTLFVTRDPTTVPPVDQSWQETLRTFGLAHPGWLATMRAITHIGDTVTILGVDLALFAFCLYRRRPRTAWFVALVGLGGWALRILLRDLVDRPRPLDPLWSATDASFPSGHTSNSMLMATLIVVVVWPYVSGPERWALAAGAPLVAVAVGFSRVAGAVHWPTDVLGGWLLAAAFAGLVAAVFPWPPQSPTPSPL